MSTIGADDRFKLLTPFQRAFICEKMSAHLSLRRYYPDQVQRV